MAFGLDPAAPIDHDLARVIRRELRHAVAALSEDPVVGVHDAHLKIVIVPEPFLQPLVSASVGPSKVGCNGERSRREPDCLH
jgi:hypothetical protein